jgi:oligoendopeptidase F
MRKLLGVLMLLLSISTQQVLSQTRERSQVPLADTWNLADLYPTDEAWSSAKTQVVSQFDQILRYKGKLSSSPAELLACLNLNSQIIKDFGRLMSYASMKSDQDTRDSKYLGMKQELMQLISNYTSKASYVEPEILAMDKVVLDQAIAQEAGLAVYKMYLGDLQRRKAHTLSENEEKILAESMLIADVPSSIYSIFSNAELPYPDVKLSDGTVVKLDQAGYARYRALPNRADREIVFQAFFKTLDGFRRTFGTELYGNVKKDLFYARARHYNSCLESALDGSNIPVEVYHALITNVNNNLPTFHRYLNLRKRMLGLDTLKYSDLYTPVVKGVDLQYTIEQARQNILEAMNPLGKQYLSGLTQALNDRWIDVYPTTGKRSGAYSNGSAYDVHPYILLNYNGQYEDMSTLAHELGHTMHSYFSNKAQPFATADYPIFVAEVASTFNEALLIHSQLQKIKDDDTRLSILMSYLDRIKGTVFRQTQFAEFELRIHEMAEKGEALTGDSLTKLYGEIVKKYYGDDQGVCKVDDLYSIEWAYIPHFYYNFYVYQYSTSFTASTALSERVINKEKGVVDKYIAFISSGGSDYPINLLKKAGEDMTTSEPFNKTMAAMNRTMDEIEKILNKRGM